MLKFWACLVSPASVTALGLALFNVAAGAAGPPLSFSTRLSELPQEAPAGAAVFDERPTVDTLAEALGAAWRTEPRVLEAQSTLAASGFDVLAARTGYYPFVTVGANQGDDGDLATSVRVIQPLWNGGLTRAEVDGAKQAEREAMAGVDVARLEVGREVIAAYFDLLAAETQIEQWDLHVLTLSRLVGVIQRRAEEGVAPEADVQTAISRVRQAEAGRESSRSLAAVQRAELARLAGVEAGRVQWPAPSSQLAPSALQPNLDRAVLERHPEMVLAEALIGRQRAEERRQRAAIWPELQLQYRIDVEGVRSSQADGALLVMQYETGNGLRGYRSSQAESARTRAATERLAQARRDVITRLRVANAELAAAVAQRRSQAAAVAATDVLLESFLRQFEVGRKSWVEVLNASREANDTRLQAITAERQFWLSNATFALESLNWERIAGDTGMTPGPSPGAAARAIGADEAGESPIPVEAQPADIDVEEITP